MFHRSMYLGRGYKSTLRLASSQHLTEATAAVTLFPQIWRNFSNIASISIDIFRGGDHYCLQHNSILRSAISSIIQAAIMEDFCISASRETK